MCWIGMRQSQTRHSEGVLGLVLTRLSLAPSGLNLLWLIISLFLAG